MSVSTRPLTKKFFWGEANFCQVSSRTCLVLGKFFLPRSLFGVLLFKGLFAIQTKLQVTGGKNLVWIHCESTVRPCEAMWGPVRPLAIKDFSFSFIKREWPHRDSHGLTMDSQGIHIRFVGLTDQEVTMDQKNVLGIIFPPMHLNSLLNIAKPFTKRSPWVTWDLETQSVFTAFYCC